MTRLSLAERKRAINLTNILDHEIDQLIRIRGLIDMDFPRTRAIYVNEEEMKLIRDGLRMLAEGGKE